MFRFRDYSISKKLTWMNMLVGTVALSLACAAFVTYDLITFREGLLSSLSIRAQIVGSNSVSAVLFNDPDSAVKTLSALQAAPHIEYAAIYTPDGRPFAAYWRDPARRSGPLPAMPAAQTRIHWLSNQQITVVIPIAFQGTPAAVVCIRSDLREWTERLQHYALIVAAVLLLCLLAAWLTSSVIRHAVAEPIVRLSETARVVSRDKNYSVRAPLTRNRDELAELIATFNGMLAKIQERDAALRSEIAERKRVEEVRERLASVVDSSEDAIISKTLDGIIQTWNHGAEKVFGYPAEEAIGKPMLMLIPPERAGEEPYILARIRKGESVEHFETVRLRKDGKKIDISATISPLRDSSGAIVGASKIARDITQRKCAEEALRHSDARRRFALQTAKLGDWELDLATLKATRSFLHDEIFGYYSPLPEWGIGTLLRHVHPEDRGRVWETFQNCVRQGKRWEFECRIICLNGDTRWLWSCGDPYMDPSGDVTRMFGIVQDITERKKTADALAGQAEELSRQAEELLRSQQALETQKLMLQSVLNSMVEGLVAADESGKFIIWNPAAEKILGLGAANLSIQEWTGHYGLYLADTVTPFPTEQNPLLRAIRGEVNGAEVFVHNPELAQGVWLEASASPLRDNDGVIRGGVVAFRDITQRKNDEGEIRKLNEELEERVTARTAELAAANQELEAFTYSVAHDLRAPLRHISGFSKILMEDFAPALAPEAQRYLERVQDGTYKMGQLVDELLSLARVGRQSLNIQATGLNSIVAEVVSLLEPETKGRQIEWKINGLPFVECDPTLMKQVFQNLISNAIKYSRPRPHTVIEIGESRDGGEAAIFVRDNGVGFNMKYKDKLFGVFQRLHRAEDFEGTGVGLATVHRIIKKHNGRVWAEAELDRGATFYFTMGSVARAASQTQIAVAGVPS